MRPEKWFTPYPHLHLRLTNYVQERIRVVGSPVSDPTLDPTKHWIVLPKMRTFVRPPGRFDKHTGRLYPAGLTAATTTELSAPPLATHLTSSQAVTLMFLPRLMPPMPFPPAIRGWEAKAPCPLQGHPSWNNRRPCINPWHLHGLEPPTLSEFEVPDFLTWVSMRFVHLKPTHDPNPTTTLRDWFAPAPAPAPTNTDTNTPSLPPPDPLDGAVEAIETFNAVLLAFPLASRSDIERELSATFSSTRVAELVPLLLSLIGR